MSQVTVLETPIKSEGDKKEYRLIKLANGLKALLVSKSNDGTSTESEDLAAADLTITVGSFQDPSNAMGLAHFLEHMLHMGSRKYPEENGHNDFLTANGGRRNATTSSEYTTYFFDVSESAFPEALDRLEQMIEDPLLSQNSMQREREAIDSEFEMRMSNEAVRFQSILCSLIKDTHPASNFNCGNLKTLKENISDDELHSELVKFHAKYVGNKMFLAVQSSRSLDDLQELVMRFAAIKSGDEDDKAETLSVEEIFKPEFFNDVHFIMPKTAKKSLILTWAIPPIQQYYKCAPFDYIANVMKNAGDGGVSNYLKAKHWLTDIGIYMEESSFASNTHFTLVRLVADLADVGTEEIEKVLEAIFAYLLMLKETSIEEHRRLYSDLKETTENEFKFHVETKAIDNVLDLCTNMTIYDDIDIIRGKPVYHEFDAKVLSDAIEHLNQRKFNISVLSDEHKSYPLREKYFNVEYDTMPMPEQYKRLWEERKSNPEFFLERPNPFKTTNFEIFEAEDEAQVGRSSLMILLIG